MSPLAADAASAIQRHTRPLEANTGVDQALEKQVAGIWPVEKNDKRLKSGMGGRCHASGKRRLSVDHHAKGRKGTPPRRTCIIRLPCADYAVDEYLTDNDHLVYPAEGCHCLASI